MKAILLAAGLGTRLRPITDTIPKCLVSINGRPLLDIWLGILSNAGVNSFLVNTHYFADQVEKYIKGSLYKNNVLQVYEAQLLGTAGTLIANYNFFNGGDGILLHADNYCKADFSSFLLAHKNRPSDCLMTMMLFKTSTPSSCGIVELDSKGRVIKFHEKVDSPPSDLANGAIYILSAEMLKILVTEMPNVTDFSTQVLPKFLRRIFTWKTDNLFIDIGTPENLLLANTNI
jgi:mannose-1-phosphate guanylyltransferase